MRYVLLPALVLLALCGCAAHTRDLYLSGQTDEPLRQVNRETERRTVHLVLRDGRSFVARGAMVLPDSTFWRAPGSGEEIRVSTAEVHRDRIHAALVGGASGALWGAGIGALVGRQTIYYFHSPEERKVAPTKL